MKFLKYSFWNDALLFLKKVKLRTPLNSICLYDICICNICKYIHISFYKISTSDPKGPLLYIWRSLKLINLQSCALFSNSLIKSHKYSFWYLLSPLLFYWLSRQGRAATNQLFILNRAFCWAGLDSWLLQNKSKFISEVTNSIPCHLSFL